MHKLFSKSQTSSVHFSAIVQKSQAVFELYNFYYVSSQYLNLLGKFPAGIGEEEAQVSVEVPSDLSVSRLSRKHSTKSVSCDCFQALLVSHLIAADRIRRHPDMWQEIAYFSGTMN